MYSAGASESLEQSTEHNTETFSLYILERVDSEL